jgi:hypothetical protein
MEAPRWYGPRTMLVSALDDHMVLVVYIRLPTIALNMLGNIMVKKVHCDHCKGQYVSHPVLEGKPNANHVRARISYSRTQQLHNMDIITQCSK